MNKPINLITAIDQNRGLGKDNSLVWSLSKDMKYFKDITTSTKDPNLKNAVIMGRKTWQSIPEKFRPLPDRSNVILSKTLKISPTNTKLFDDLEMAVQFLQADPSIESIFIIGGASIYQQALKNLAINKIYITAIQKTYDCDTFLAPLPPEYILKKESDLHQENNVNFTFQVFAKN